MTLLEKARKVPHSERRTPELTPQILDLAVAWLRDEITTVQAATALRQGRANAERTMLSILRRAARAGILKVMVTK
jgi:hypothetical protein